MNSYQQKASRRFKTKYLYFILTAFTQYSLAEVVYLGTDAACDYDSSQYSLQDVIDAGEEMIRVTNQQTLNEDLVISGEQMRISGGYEDCSTFQTSTKTTVQGTGNKPVIIILPTNDDLFNSFHLEGLVIKNGQSTDFYPGGGISLRSEDDKDVRLLINNSLITQNVGNTGGGVYINGNDIAFTMNDTLIFNNRSYGEVGGSGLGGGMYCNKAKVYINGDSGVSYNRAGGSVQNSGHGGGVYADTGCLVNVNSSSEGGLLDYRGIAYNSSNGHGGGIYINSGRIDLSSSNRPINVNDNSADVNNDGYGDGGGIYLEGNNSTIKLHGALIEGNVASNGAGIMVKDGALIQADNDSGYCWDMYWCNQIVDNKTTGQSGFGGGLYMINGLADLEHTHLAYNQANTGVAINGNSQSSLILYRSLIYRNGEGHNNEWGSQHTIRLVNSNLIAYQITTAINDTTGATFSMYNSHRIINNSIIYEPLTNQSGNFLGGSGSQACNLLDNNLGWQGGSNSFLEEPGFVDTEANDFHIIHNSAAIDKCADGQPGMPSQNIRYDVDRQVAPVNISSAVDGLGYYDIGADEYHNPDVIFSYGFD